MKFICAIFYLISFCHILQAQNFPHFSFASDTTQTYETDFIEINNLILLPISVNASDTLYFILDSGAENIVLFSSSLDTIPLDTNYLRTVKVAGLGSLSAISAFVSANNSMSFGAIRGHHLNLVYVKDEALNFADLLGHEVHGILGVSIFHSFVIQIDYITKKIKFIRKESFKPKRRSVALDVSIIKKRPYINLTIEMDDQINLVTNLLVDLGESKPLSLYLNSHEFIFLPAPNYNANLGRGMTGTISGKVAKINMITLDRYYLKRVITAFPNEADLIHVKQHSNRNGSLGAGILRKFNCTFDLSNQKIYLKKNSHFRHPFSYDKTGLILVAKGELYNQFEITGVIEDSPGQKAGVLANDQLIKIDDKDLTDKKLGTVLDILEKSGRKIDITILRNGIEKIFRLKIIRFK